MLSKANIALLLKYKVYLRAHKHLNSGTITNMGYEIRKFLLFVGNNSFEGVVFSDYLRHRYACRIYKKSYHNKIIAALRNFYTFLVNEGIIKNNVASALDFVRPEKLLPDTLSMYELYLIERAMMADAYGSRNIALLEVLLSSGMRISECLALRLADLDKNGPVTVVGKGNKERQIFINPEARQKIEAWVSVKPTTAEYIFTNNRGEKLSRSGAYKIIAGASKKAGIKKRVGPHTLRHTLACLLMEGGADLISIRDILGHATVTTTEIYTRVNVNHLRNELQKHHPRW